MPSTMRKVGRDRDDREGIDDDGAVEKWCLATPLASNARNDDGGDMAMAGGCVGVVNAGGVMANNVIGRGWLPETGGALPRPPSHRVAGRSRSGDKLAIKSIIHTNSYANFSVIIVRSFKVLIPMVVAKIRLSQLIQKEEISIADSFGVS